MKITIAYEYTVHGYRVVDSTDPAESCHVIHSEIERVAEGQTNKDGKAVVTSITSEAVEGDESIWYLNQLNKLIILPTKETKVGSD